jgi:hypothetical protein
MLNDEIVPTTLFPLFLAIDERVVQDRFLQTSPSRAVNDHQIPVPDDGCFIGTLCIDPSCLVCQDIVSNQTC